MNPLVKALEPFAKMYKELTEIKLQQGGIVFQYNNASITVADLLNATNALSLYSQSKEGEDYTEPILEELLEKSKATQAAVDKQMIAQSKENEGKQAVWVKVSERLPDNPNPKQRVFIKNDGKRDVMVFIIDWESKKGNWCWSLAFNDSKGKMISKKEFEKIEWLDETTFGTNN